jgi:hypothetical protein
VPTLAICTAGVSLEFFVTVDWIALLSFDPRLSLSPCLVLSRSPTLTARRFGLRSACIDAAAARLGSGLPRAGA